MQFKGSVRAPGDKDPGVRVVLDIDEYHLEIRRDSELIGRYYLADVEVARDIAERFILFLGDDEVEFLADDALHFAYEGVTAMQDGWLEAQRKKRRHRRAADDSARRKDGEPPLEPMTSTYVPGPPPSDSETIRARRRQATAQAEPATARAEPARKAQPTKAAPVKSQPAESKPSRKAQPVQAKAAQPERTGPQRNEPARSEPARSEPHRAEPVKSPPRTEQAPAARTRETAKPIEHGRKSKAGKEPTVSIAARLGGLPDPSESEPDQPLTLRKPVVPEPDPQSKPSKTASRNGVDDLGRVRVPEPASRSKEAGLKGSVLRDSGPDPVATRTETAARSDGAGGRTLVGDARPETDDELRFTQQGHHPAETSGLLSKLRRQPKISGDHIHKFKESGSSVGLVRRVCIECAFVSIGRDDE